MEQGLFSRLLAKIGIAILVIALFDLVYLNYLTFKGDETGQTRSFDLQPSPIPNLEASNSSSPSTAAGEESLQEESEKTIIQTAQREIFIPVGSGSTKNNSYTNLPGAQVTIDSSKYGVIQSADFEANISVTDGNGKMYAQLYNVTAKRPVWNSEISTSSANGVLAVSAPITLDLGQNLYQIQAKTDLTEFAANVSTGRIKIVLR